MDEDELKKKEEKRKEEEKVTIRLLCAIRGYEVPRPTTTIDFNTSIGGELRTEARELLKTATLQRSKYVESLTYGGSVPDARNIAGAIDNYLPQAWRIMASMESSADANIQLKKKLEFVWKSVLARSKANKDWKFGVLVFEVVMLLVARALVHQNVARQHLATLFPSSKDQKSNSSSSSSSSKSATTAPDFSAASTELRKGAGIAEFAAKKLIPRWASPPAKLPHEGRAAVASVLSLMMQANAQRIAVAKAIHEGKTPPSLVAKLLIGIKSKYDLCARTLRTLSREDFDTIDEAIRDELGTIPGLLTVLARKYQSLAANGKSEYGQSVALMKTAVEGIASVPVGATLSANMQPLINQERVAMNRLHKELEEENSKVYFDTVPSRIPELPDGKFIVKPTPYETTDLSVVSFAEVEKAPPQEEMKTTKNYFGFNKKEEEKPIKAPPGIDPETFAGLPSHIQKEIVEQYDNDQKAEAVAKESETGDSTSL